MEYKEVPQVWRYILVTAASLACSLIGIGWAVYKHCPTEGGRGGAIGTAIAFATLFIRPDYGLKIYEKRKENISPSLPLIDHLSLETKAIVASLYINSNGQKKQNVAIAAASLIGTITWGFGDIFAKWLS